jgi:WD40 repeat protein
MVGPAVVVSLATLSDGNLASSYADGTIRIWNPTTNTQIKNYNIGGTTMRLMPTGTSLIFNRDNSNLQILNTINDQQQSFASSNHFDVINAAAISTTSPFIATVSDDFRGVATNTSTLIPVIKTESSRLLAVTFLNDGRVAIAGCPAAIRIFSP